ncbi:MAG: hypothetical protein LBS33_04055 [Streptococcaceae bacterium]|nr:hypothetical protein [Streptococcaceae bacterium]
MKKKIVTLTCLGLSSFLVPTASFALDYTGSSSQTATMYLDLVIGQSYKVTIPEHVSMTFDSVEQIGTHTTAADAIKIHANDLFIASGKILSVKLEASPSLSMSAESGSIDYTVSKYLADEASVLLLGGDIITSATADISEDQAAGLYFETEAITSPGTYSGQLDFTISVDDVI